MTSPVGSIRLDLTIDGSRLSEQAVAQVQRALAPVLADVNRRLDEVERHVQSTTRETEKSAAKQTTAFEAVAHAVEDVGEEQTKTAAKTEVSGRSQTRSINAVTRAVEAQARAYDKLLAAKTFAATAPTPSSGGGGGGNGTGPGFGVPTPRNPPPPASGGGSRGRGGGRGGGGLLGGFSGAGIVNAGALAIGNIPAATTAVVSLVGAVQQLVQVGGLLPGVFAGGAASLGTAVLGFHGMADAVTALNKAAESGDPKDLLKATAAMKDMAPAAVNVAKAVSTFTQGPLKDLQKSTAQTMFDGVDKSLTGLADKTMPTLSRGTAEVGSAWNKTFKELGRVGGLDSTQSFLDKIFGNTAEAQTRANAAIAPLIHGLGTLTSESTDFLPRLGDGIAKLSTRFDNFITKSVGNGNFDKWINQGIEGADHLGTTILNVGKIITDITKAAGGDGGLLNILDKGSTALANFLGSDAGQAKLGAFFADGRQQLAQWLPILQNLGPVLMDVYQASRQWSDLLMPFLRDALGLLGNFPGVVQTAVLAFLAFKTISPFVGLLGDLDKLNVGLGNAGTKAGGLKGALGRLGGGGALLGGSLFLGGAVDAATRGISPTNALESAGGGALVGTSIGGPIGALIGALTGLTAAVIADKVKRDGDNAKSAAGVQAILDRPNAPTFGGGAAALGLTTLHTADDQTKKTAQQDYYKSFGITGSNLQQQVDLGNNSFASRYARDELINSGKATAPQLDASIANARLALDSVHQLGDAIRELPSGDFEIKNPTPVILEQVKDLGLQVTRLPNGKILIDANTDVAKNKIDAFINSYKNSIIDVRANIVGTSTGPTPTTGQLLLPTLRPPGRAGGGVIPGYSPGVDNVLTPMSGGEGVIIPEAMRALGGRWLYSLNSRFRAGLSRRGYADGGIVGADGAALAGDSVVGLLSQIRDLLAGKSGATGPLTDIAGNTGALSSTVTGAGGAGGTTGAKLGPFGTPIKAHNTAYDAAAAAISALGGDPEKFLGADPATFFGAGGPVAAGGVPGLGVDTGKYSAALSGFARSGNLDGSLTGLGLDANDPVVKAIVAARNKKKGGLDDDSIAGLVDQVLGGGFTGVLDPSNTSLVTALQTYKEKLAKGTTGTRGAAAVAGPAGVPLMPLGGGADAVISLAQQSSGGKYAAASDLAHGLSDCSGAVSDLVELITKGQATPDRLFTTHNEASVLQSLGATPGFVPGNLNIGFNEGHTAATLPNGVNFESGGGTGQGATYGGNAAGALDKQFTQHYTLPAGALSQLPGGGAVGNAVSGVAADMCSCVGDQMSPFGEMAAKFGSDALGAAAPTVTDVAQKVADAAIGVGKRPLPDKPLTQEQLLAEKNPALLATFLGVQVGDYSRTGGGADAQNLTTNGGADYTAQGQLTSNTAALLDRTLTSMEAANQARQKQLLDVMSQIRDQLSEQVLKPLIESAVGAALQTAQAAATPPPAGKAFGGPIWGGVPGRDSVPILAMPGEHMLTVGDVAAMGGHRGVMAFRQALHGAPGFADGGTIGGKNVNDIVGAEFFGVSQVPIIGAIVNVLVSILLSVLGIQIQARDTLQEITGEVRKFRGDFQAFDATGRLTSDTSALLERSSTSEQEAADERVRILKLVISELIKFIFQQIVIPITKAVADTAIQAGASAAGGALNTVAPGAGGIVSSLISSAGTAAVDVGTEIWSKAVGAITPVAVDIVGQLLQGIFPDLMKNLFSGKWLAELFGGGGPKGGTSGLGGGGLAGGFATLFAGMAAASDMSFDAGGVAMGKGLLLKDVIKPERVLSPRETELHARNLDTLDEFVRTAKSNGKQVTVHAPITVIGGRETTAQDVQDSILELVGR